jgi:hypothetical protein
MAVIERSGTEKKYYSIMMRHDDGAMSCHLWPGRVEGAYMTRRVLILLKDDKLTGENGSQLQINDYELRKYMRLRDAWPWIP